MLNINESYKYIFQKNAFKYVDLNINAPNLKLL